MAIYTNPSGTAVGTDESDTFNFTVAPVDGASVVAGAGFDHVNITFEYDQPVYYTVRDIFDSGVFHGDIRPGNGSIIVLDDVEDVTIEGTLNPDVFELGITPNSSLLTASFDGGGGIDRLIFDFSTRTIGINFQVNAGLITSSFGQFSNFERFEIRAGSGDDTITTGDFDDDVQTGAGFDVVNTGAGNDIIYSTSGGGTVDGGSGYDIWTGGISESDGRTTVTMGQTVIVSNETNEITVSNVESASVDTFGGDDEIVVTQHYAGFVNGGEGNDSLTYNVATGAEREFLINTTVDGTFLGGISLSNLEGFGFSDIEIIDFHGGPGADSFRILGIYAPDGVYLDGGAGVDSLNANFSLLQGSSSFEVGRNGVVASNRGHFSNIENFNLLGGDAGDTFVTGSGADFLGGGLGDDYLSSGGGLDVLVGGDGADTLIGGAGNDYLYGDDFGDPASDRQEGGSGDDLYVRVDALDQVIELANEGHDTVEAEVDYVLPNHVEDLKLLEAHNLPAGRPAPTAGTGNALNNLITGNSEGNILSGKEGDDTIAGGMGSDSLTGGTGSDSFIGTYWDLNGDTVTDMSSADRIVLSDMDLATFTFTLTGSTLAYRDSNHDRATLTLTGGVFGVVATQATEGGVQLTVAGPPPPTTRSKLILTEAGQDLTIGGNVAVFGTTAGGEVIEVVRGNILLDASFNGGGDTIVLPGAAGSYTAILSGSFVTLSGGDISVAIPVGVVGLAVQFGNSTRTLRIDTGSGQVMLGTQAVTSTTQPVAASGPPLVDAAEVGPESLARLILTEAGQDVDIAGNVSIFGTTGAGEVITVLGGTVRLDASFNAGGDTVVLPGAAGSYTAILSGSFVTISGGEISVAIPVGIAGLTVDFADADRTLRVDTSTGQVLLGTQAVTATAQPVAPGPPASEALFTDKASTDAEAFAIELDTFETSPAALEIDSFHFG